MQFHLFASGYVYTVPDRIGFYLQRTVWNRSKCLHRTILELVRNGSKTGPAKQQVRSSLGSVWIRSAPVPERSCVIRRPIRSDFRTRSMRIRVESVTCKHSLSGFCSIISVCLAHPSYLFCDERAVNL